MSSQYPIQLFEIEENEDESLLVTCLYDSFAKVLQTLKESAKVSSTNLPIVFLGVSEQWNGQCGLENTPVLISTHVLEAVREKLAGAFYSKATANLNCTQKIISCNSSKASIWLWGLPTLTQIPGSRTSSYICLLSFVCDRPGKKPETLTEFVAKLLLLSLCDRVLDITTESSQVIQKT